MKTYQDIKGDGGSNVVEQVQAIRSQLKEQLAGVKRIVGVASGKGGVGKSTVSVLLALALKARGLDVALLDADFNGPCLWQMLGLANQQPLPGKQGLVLPRSQDQVGVMSLGSFLPEEKELRLDSVAKGDSFTWRQTKEFTLLSEILTGTEWGELDFLLLDLPPGTERTVYYAEFFGPEIEFVLVSTPSGLSHGVVSRTVSAFKNLPNRVLGIVQNMAGYYCADCAAIKPLFAEHYSIDPKFNLLGRIPFDPKLASLCDTKLTLSSVPSAVLNSASDIVNQFFTDNLKEAV